MRVRGRLVAFALTAGLAALLFVLWHERAELELRYAEWELRELPASAAQLDLRVPGGKWHQSYGSQRETRFKAQAIRARVEDAENHAGPSAKSSWIKARTDIAMGKYDDAIDLLRSAESLDPNDARIPFAVGLAFAARMVAEERAIDVGTSMEAFLRSAEMHGGAGPETFYNLGIVAERLPAPRAAVGFWQKSLSVEIEADWRRNTAERIVSCERLMNGRKRKMQEVTFSRDPGNLPKGGLEVMLQIAEADWLKDPSRFGAQLGLLGQYLAREKSDRWLRDLLHGEKAVEAAVLLAQAAAANRDGRNEDAVAAAMQARHSFSGRSSGRLASSVELAYAYAQMGQAPECLDAIHGTRAAATVRGYTWLANRAWLQELTCKSMSRTYDVLADWLKAAEEIQKMGWPGLNLRARGAQSEPLLSLTTPSEAWRNAHEALTLYWNGLYSEITAQNFYVPLALACDGAEERRAALVLMKEALDALETHSNKRLRARRLINLANAQLEQRLYKEAARSYEEAALITPSTSVARQNAVLAEVARAKSDLESGQLKSALSRLNGLTESDAASTRLGYYERLSYVPVMGKALLASGNTKEALALYRTAVAECLERLKPVKGKAQRQMILRETEQAWRGMGLAQIENADFKGALQSWQMFRGGRDPNHRDIEPPAGTAWLSYAVMDGRLGLWVTDSEGSEFHWLGKETVAKDTERLTALLASSDSPLGEIHNRSRSLYEKLISPVERRISKAATLVIDADTGLSAVPWMVLENREGVPMIEEHAIALSYGWSEAGAEAGTETVRLEPSLIVSDPELEAAEAANYPPTRDMRDSAAGLGTKLREAAMLSGAEARLDAVRRMLPHRRLFHYAGHGIANGGFGALVLAREPGYPLRLLKAQEIAGLDLKGLDLVVLAACSSGIGEHGKVFNLSSLVRAFLEGGAARVVAAQWNIAANPTARFMDRFYYEGVFKGMAPAEALREAARAIRKEKLTAHPYYWAAFAIYGRL